MEDRSAPRHVLPRGWACDWGRIQRINRWDVFVHPHAVGDALRQWNLHVSQGGEALAFPMSFAAFVRLSYFCGEGLVRVWTTPPLFPRQKPMDVVS